MLSAACGLVVLILFGVATSGFYLGTNADRMTRGYQDGPLVSDDERAALDELASLVGPDERVMNDPNDGSAWMYALHGVAPMFGHVVGPYAVGDKGVDQQDLLLSFNCLDSDEHIRDLVESYNITYVYLAAGFVRPAFERYPGLEDLDDVTSLREVWADQENDLVIYEIDLAPLIERDSSVCTYA